MAQDTQSVWTVLASITGTVFLALYGKFKGKKKPELTDRQKFEDSLRDNVKDLYDQLSELQDRINRAQRAHEDCETEKIILRQKGDDALRTLKKINEDAIIALKKTHEEDVIILLKKIASLKRQVTMVKNRVNKVEESN